MRFHEHRISNCGTGAHQPVGQTSFCSVGCRHSSAATQHFSNSHPGLTQECRGAFFCWALMPDACYAGLSDTETSDWPARLKRDLKRSSLSRASEFSNVLLSDDLTWCSGVDANMPTNMGLKLEEMCSLRQLGTKFNVQQWNSFIFPSGSSLQDTESNSQTTRRGLQKVFSLLVQVFHLSRQRRWNVWSCLPPFEQRLIICQWRGDEDIPHAFCFYSMVENR